MRPITSALLAAACAAASLAPVPAAAGTACRARVERAAGGTWTAHPVDDLRGAPFTWRMTADEDDPRLVVVADYEGILVTRDGGCTWGRGAEYADFLAPFSGSVVDAVIAGSGRDRSLHVLVAPWSAFVPNGPAKLLSSFDDGATWSVVDAPPTAGPAAFSSLSLTASPSAPGDVYLLAGHGPATAVYARSGDGEWQRQSLSVASPDPGSCAPCPARPLRSLHADPSNGDLWGPAFGLSEAADALAHSADGGASWGYRPVPALSGGVSLADVGPRSIVLAGDFREYAVSRDGGRSWAVGKYPKLTSSTGTSVDVFEIAHFDEGRATALLPGSGSAAGWSGNVLVFDGRRWTNAAPPGFAGYSRTTPDGDDLSFAALASSAGPLLALSSRGELMTFRPLRGQRPRILPPPS